jgi:hypothetical protein
MALEWPDLEAEQKKKAKAKRQNKKEGFIVEDSDSDSDDLRPRKRAKECKYSFFLDSRYQLTCLHEQRDYFSKLMLVPFVVLICFRAYFIIR